jgi:hypothetical protein
MNDIYLYGADMIDESGNRGRIVSLDQAGLQEVREVRTYCTIGIRMLALHARPGMTDPPRFS